MIRIGVVGGGTMGSGIAQSAAQAGFEVELAELIPGVLEKARHFITKNLEVLEAKGKIPAGESSRVLGRLSFSDLLTRPGSFDLVIEAIVEKPEAKRSLFHSLATQVRSDCILATNTSSLSIASLAAGVPEPGRFIGLHFFNPATLMKLVEVIPAIQTAAPTTEFCLDLLRKWGKIPVLAGDTPGFIVNRVARPFYGEALRLLDEGVAGASTIDHAMKTLGGFPMGPFELMDFIGHDINYTVTETVFRSFFNDPRYTPSFSQKRLMEAGFLGRKTGRGFYNYGPEASVPDPDTRPELLREIFERILSMLINEAADALHFGVASAGDIELAMTRGVNYPKGLLRWADEWGSATVVERLDSLFNAYHEPRYRCSVLLRRMAAEGRRFFPAT